MMMTCLFYLSSCNAAVDLTL